VGTRYATRKDVYDFGLPRGTVGIPARHISSALAATNALELEDHGFETDDVVQLRATDGGALPGGISAGTSYYVRRLTDSSFELAASAGGPAIDLTTDGSGCVVWAPLPFDRVLEYCSRFVDPFIPAHAVPFAEGSVPLAVVGAVASLAAAILQRISGVSSISVADAAAATRTDMQVWARGVPLRDPIATVPTNTAVSGYVPAIAYGDATDPRGWGGETIR
jgi:hypothetical protein